VSQVITFYSYKGGTGRSMALANVAWVLASTGKRVLAIDWDLEAPGLHRYFQPFLNDKELIGQESQGVIDMAIDLAVRAATPVREGEQLSDEWYELYADFSKWRQKLRWPSGEPVRLGKNGRGEIDFVPAGRQGTDYAKRVNHFDWHSFYAKLGGGAFFDAAKRKLAAYDYVLIDSRTGVSDTSGICTVHMPDTLVVCFTLNYQSIKGALAVSQSVRERRPDIRIFPVPMRIDGSEEKLLHRMKNYAAEIFSPLLDPKIDRSDYWYQMEVPYTARYAYAEKLALFEDRTSITASTLPAMERLTGYLTNDEVRAAGPLPEAERVLALAEFEGVDRTGQTDVAAQQKPHVVVLIHGIRTRALWQSDLRKTLQEEGFTVHTISYSYFDVVRMLAPWQIFTGKILDDIGRQLRFALANSTGGDCSVIAHSFATLVVARMLQFRIDLVFNRVIFCGSVVPSKFPFEQSLSVFNPPLLNEVGIEDLWPVIVKTFAFGYGSTGTYGFQTVAVLDRWHRGKSLDFLNKEFCRKYWVPFLAHGQIVEAMAPEAPRGWFLVLSAIIRYGLPLLLLFGAAYSVVPLVIWVWVHLRSLG
jgi:hypothetical protein